MSTVHESALGKLPASTIGPIMVSERLHVLDILRGFAILGMFIVHFDDNASGGGPIGAIIQKAILWFVTEKSFATFAILFGVSLAIPVV